MHTEFLTLYASNFPVATVLFISVAIHSKTRVRKFQHFLQQMQNFVKYDHILCLPVVIILHKATVLISTKCSKDVKCRRIAFFDMATPKIAPLALLYFMSPVLFQSSDLCFKQIRCCMVSVNPSRIMIDPMFYPFNILIRPSIEIHSLWYPAPDQPIDVFVCSPLT